MRNPLAAAVFWLIGIAAAVAQPAVTQETSPGGIPYQRAAMPGATAQSVQVYWREPRPKTTADRFWLTQLAGPTIAAGPVGTKRAEFTEKLKDLAVGFRVNVLADSVHLGVGGQPDTFAEGAGLVGAMLANPALPPERLENFRRESQKRLAQERENEQSLAGKVWMRRLAPAAAAAPALSRDPALLEKGGVADLQGWMKEVMTRDNMVVAAAGPMDGAALGPIIDALLGGLPAIGKRGEAAALALAQPAGLVAVEKASAQTVIMAGGPASFDEDRDEALLAVATAPLYQGFSSRLYQNLREKLGAAYRISGVIERLNDKQFVFGIRSSVDHTRAVAALDGLRDEYARWHSAGVTEDELRDAKARLIGFRLDDARKPPFVAGYLGRAMLRGGKTDAMVELRKKVDALTLADVNAFIKRAFPAPPLAIVVVTPTPAAFAPVCAIKSVEDVAGCKQ